MTGKKGKFRRGSQHGPSTQLLHSTVKGLLSLLVPAVRVPLTGSIRVPGRGCWEARSLPHQEGDEGGVGRTAENGFGLLSSCDTRQKSFQKRSWQSQANNSGRHYKMTGCWVSAAAEIVFSRDIGLSGITTA